MSVDYFYLNKTKLEYFSIWALGGSGSFHAIGRTPTTRAFELLLTQQDGSKYCVGRWIADDVCIIPDTSPTLDQYSGISLNITSNLILMIFRVDGFETLSQLAQQDEVVFMRLSHLVLTRQVPELEVPMKHQFGEDFLSRYNQACERMPYIQPIDLADIS